MTQNLLYPDLPCRFDYYRAGIVECPKDIMGVLNGEFDLAEIRPTTASKMNYERGYDFIQGDDRIAQVLYGGNTGDRVLITASGDSSVPVSELIRSSFESHLVIRADVAIDYDSPGAFEVLYKLLTELADKRSLKVSHYGDYHRGIEGRTLYIGSRTSALYIRLYEKGKQKIGEGYPASENWVRLEFEFKPKNDARHTLSVTPPVGFLSCSPTSRSIVKSLTDSEMMPLTGLTSKSGYFDPYTKNERAIAALAHQYGPTLKRLADALGSWGDVGEYLGSVIDQKDN